MLAFEIKQTAVLDPADGVTYYFGLDGDIPTVTATDHAIAGPPLACTFDSARLKVIQGTIGTAEAVTPDVWNITQGTAEAIAADGWDNDAIHLNAALADDLAVGDQWCFRVISPAWVTNPLQIQIEGTVFLTVDTRETAIAAQDSGISDNLAAILTNDSDISANVAAIAQNDSEILVNDSAISSNLAAIVTNDSDISANLAAILANDSDISALVAEQLTQDSSVSANLAAIVTNDSDISALVAEQLTQDSSVSANLAAILTNDSDISANVVSIAALGDTSAIEADILSNDSDISSNLARIDALDLDAGEIIALNALLAQSPPGMLSASEVAALRSRFNLARAGDEGTARG